MKSVFLLASFLDDMVVRGMKLPKYLMLDSGTRAYAYVWWKDIKIIWASKNFSVLTHLWWWRELVVVMKGWCTRWSDKRQNHLMMERIGVTSQRSTERSFTDDLFFITAFHQASNWRKIPWQKPNRIFFHWLWIIAENKQKIMILTCFVNDNLYKGMRLLWILMPN